MPPDPDKSPISPARGWLQRERSSSWVAVTAIAGFSTHDQRFRVIRRLETAAIPGEWVLPDRSSRRGVHHRSRCMTSATGLRTIAPNWRARLRSGFEDDRHVVPAIADHVSYRHRFGGQLEAREAVQQRIQQDSGPEPDQPRADAHVGTNAERQV